MTLENNIFTQEPSNSESMVVNTLKMTEKWCRETMAYYQFQKSHFEAVKSKLLYGETPIPGMNIDGYKKQIDECSSKIIFYLNEAQLCKEEIKYAKDHYVAVIADPTNPFVSKCYLFSSS